MIQDTKRYDIATVVVSLILGIAFAVLVLFFPVVYPLGFRFGFLLSIIALALEVITASSLLRQDRHLNRCICSTSLWVLIPAIMLFAASMLGSLLATLNVATGILFPIITFVIYTLISFTFFGLYRFLVCLSKAGCKDCGCDH